MRLRPLAFGAMAFAGWASAAAAQQMPGMPAVEPKRQFKTIFSVQTIYDSNIARSTRLVAVTRRIKPEDFTVRPQVTISAVQPFGGQALFLNASAGYDAHKENKRLDRGRFDVQGGYGGRVGPCQTNYYVSYRGQQSDLEDADLTTSSNFVQSIGQSAGLDCSRGTGPGFGMTASREESKNSATVMRLSNHTNRSLDAHVGYGNPSLGQLSLTYGYSNVRFPNRLNPGRPLGDGFETTNFGLSVEHDFGNRLKVSLQGGKTHLKREFAPPGVPQKFNSATYAGTVDYRLGQRIRVNLQAERAVNPASRPGNLYDIDTGGSATVTYNFGTRFTVSLGESVQDTNSNADTKLPTVITKSRTYATIGTIVYRQSARGSLTLDVRQEDRTTNVPAFDYSATRIGLTAQVRY